MASGGRNFIVRIEAVLFRLALACMVLPFTGLLVDAVAGDEVGSVERLFRCHWNENRSACAALDHGITVSSLDQGNTLQYTFDGENTPERDFGRHATAALMKLRAPAWKNAVSWIDDEFRRLHLYGYSGATIERGVFLRFTATQNSDGLRTVHALVTSDPTRISEETRDARQYSGPFHRSPQEIRKQIAKIVGCSEWEDSERPDAISCALGPTPFEVSLSADMDGFIRLIEISFPVDERYSDIWPVADIRQRLLRVVKYLLSDNEADWVAQNMSRSVEPWFRDLTDTGDEIVLLQHMGAPFPRLEGEYSSLVMLDKKFLSGDGTLRASRHLEDYFSERDAYIAWHRFGITQDYLPPREQRELPTEYEFIPICRRLMNIEERKPPCQ